MANEKPNGNGNDGCVGELVIWRRESPKIVIYDVSELKSLEARRGEGLFSGSMARVEFPGMKALDMYNPLMAAVRKGRYDFGTYYSNEVECGCQFAKKYLTESGIIRVGNILMRLRGRVINNGSD